MTKEYTLEELKELDMKLEDVQFKDNWEEDPEMYISSIYLPKNKIEMKCSVCGKKKEEYIIVGKTLVPPAEAIKNKVKILHKTFLIVCKGCHTARNI